MSADQTNHSIGYDVATALWQGMRPYQEDTLLADFHGGVNRGFAVLADGMGGHAAGDLASRLVVIDAVSHLKFLMHDGEALEKNLQSELSSAVDAANDVLRDRGADDRRLQGMGATFLVTVMFEDRLYWASVGDSPLYLWREGKLKQLNEDHSMAPVIDQMVKTGELSAEEAAKHPDRNALTSVLMGRNVKSRDIPKTATVLDPGDVLIQASDGLQYLDDETIAKELEGLAADASSREIADRLMGALHRLGHPQQDNTAILVLQLTPGMGGSGGGGKAVAAAGVGKAATAAERAVEPASKEGGAVASATGPDPAQAADAPPSAGSDPEAERRRSWIVPAALLGGAAVALGLYFGLPSDPDPATTDPVGTAGAEAEADGDADTPATPPETAGDTDPDSVDVAADPAEEAVDPTTDPAQEPEPAETGDEISETPDPVPEIEAVEPEDAAAPDEGDLDTAQTPVEAETPEVEPSAPETPATEEGAETETAPALEQPEQIDPEAAQAADVETGSEADGAELGANSDPSAALDGDSGERTGQAPATPEDPSPAEEGTAPSDGEGIAETPQEGSAPEAADEGTIAEVPQPAGEGRVGAPETIVDPADPSTATPAAPVQPVSPVQPAPALPAPVPAPAPAPAPAAPGSQLAVPENGTSGGHQIGGGSGVTQFGNGNTNGVSPGVTPEAAPEAPGSSGVGGVTRSTEPEVIIQPVPRPEAPASIPAPASPAPSPVPAPSPSPAPIPLPAPSPLGIGPTQQDQTLPDSSAPQPATPLRIWPDDEEVRLPQPSIPGQPRQTTTMMAGDVGVAQPYAGPRVAPPSAEPPRMNLLVCQHSRCALILDIPGQNPMIPPSFQRMPWGQGRG